MLTSIFILVLDAEIIGVHCSGMIQLFGEMKKHQIHEESFFQFFQACHPRIMNIVFYVYHHCVAANTWRNMHIWLSGHVKISPQFVWKIS